MTIRLRPHHLLCVLTYAGKGYTPDFTANFDTVAARLAAGEDAIVVDGPDEICAPWLGEDDCHCLNDSVMLRDARAAEAVALLLGRPVVAGERLSLAEHLTAMRTAFAAGTIRAACTACEWFGLCSDIAAADFSGVRLTHRPQ